MKRSMLRFVRVAISTRSAAARIDVAPGNTTVPIRYKERSIPGGCYFYFVSQTASFNCGGNAFNFHAGNYTLTTGHGYPLPPIPFTVTAGQTAVVAWRRAGT